MKNTIKLILLLSITLTILLTYFSKLTRASSGTEIEKLHKIYYQNSKNDKEILNFISEIEPSLLLSVNYENEIPLNENYELITNFLITYLQTKDTSIKYINVSDIYKLSKTIFGIDYYYITNKNIINGNKIEVNLPSTEKVELITDTQKITYNKDSIQVLKKYKYLDVKYKYILNIKNDNQIVLENVVLE